MRKRVKKIPIECCKSINEINGLITCINSYTMNIQNQNIFIDLYECDEKYYFVRLIDITDDKYEEIDFDKFKQKYSQPTLFDFFEI